MPPVDPLALSRERPEWSARVPVTRRQKAQMVVGCLVLLGLVLWQPWITARAFVLLCTLFYLLFSGYKLLLARFSIRRGAQISIAPADLAALRDAELPVYSVLVPLYREKESVRHLVAALRALDYPAEKKDVQLLVEEDDADTREALAAVALPQEFRVTVVPVSQPRTKPKACNYGLAEARGEYLVIYDAEDRPEPDQLRKAVVAFSRVGPEVACLQSRLNFYNPRFNLLTRWFTAEYSAWFDLSLPGLAAVGGIIPLGGTSNHFRTAVLQQLYGWDAFNVAEDCDLGIRIYRAGYTTRMIETTTWEEACSRLPAWIRQRTRWVKGYIQTYLVHMRRPRRLLRELGLRGFLHFQLLIGGTVVSLFLNPLYWFLVALWFLFRLEMLTSLFPGLVFALGALCLFVGNFAFVYLGAVGVHRRGYYDLVRAALISPLYWVMMSYSGWRAFFQFFADPFRWEKTQHGLSDSAQPGQ
jgi:cellulose synthase/poly-beta-1,6-N-acetylglucosamine synthase-like glycosyltransferase